MRHPPTTNSLTTTVPAGATTGPISVTVATENAHVLLLVAMFSFGIVATIVYFRVTARLASIGEATPRLLGRKDVFKMFRKYEEVADQYSWPKWLPLAYWGALMLALISGLAYVYWH